MVGYARVSSDDQKLDLQLQALKQAGCNRIYTDQGQPGNNFQREGLDKALRSMKPGGTLVVWRLDRLGRSLRGLIQVIDHLASIKAHFRSIMENIDTASSGGRLVFHMMGALAEFERTLISERTHAGLLEAKRRGMRLGRPRALSNEQIAYAIRALRYNKIDLDHLAQEFGISARTLRRYIQKNRASPNIVQASSP